MHVSTAIRKAEQKYTAAETLRRREDLLDEVNRLYRAGVSQETIAELMNMEVRQIVRMCNGQVKQPAPPQRLSFAKDPRRIARLESMADATLQLACLQRDEDPELVWNALSQLDRHALQELTVIALAGVPVDQPKSKVFAWVEEMVS